MRRNHAIQYLAEAIYWLSRGDEHGDGVAAQRLSWAAGEFDRETETAPLTRMSKDEFLDRIGKIIAKGERSGDADADPDISYR